MNRVCPKCESELGSYDHHFCTSCGTELPEELISKDESFRQVNHLSLSTQSNPDEQKNVHGYFNRLRSSLGDRVIVGVAVLLLMLVAFTIYLVVTQATLSAKRSVAPVENKSAKVDTGLMGDEMIAKYVPYEADVYIETADSQLLGRLFLEFDPGYYTLVQDIEKNTKSHTGLYILGLSSEPSMTIIIFPEKEDFGVDGLKLDGYDWLVAREVEKSIVISTREDNISNTLYAKSGLAKNLIQHPKFVTYTKQNIPEGKIIIYTSSSEVKDMLIMLLSKSDSDTIRSILEDYKQTESNFVIL
ncbi:TFIIB-type zinc ribbon-containing protein [Patescibacteria group bacterium]|nr:TFIIB-type zinc ribbon-containing protein [Patescibacteria group bacterium]